MQQARRDPDVMEPDSTTVDDETELTTITTSVSNPMYSPNLRRRSIRSESVAPERSRRNEFGNSRREMRASTEPPSPRLSLRDSEGSTTLLRPVTLQSQVRILPPAVGADAATIAEVDDDAERGVEPIPTSWPQFESIRGYLTNPFWNQRLSNATQPRPQSSKHPE